MRRGGAWLVWLVLVLWSAGLWAKTVHYYYTDPQGTVLAKTDASGHILVRSDYRPYGRPVQAQGALPAGPGYTGHVNDPDTGLVYMQARYYDLEAGFLSADPLRPIAGNIYNFNRYVFADDNPILNSDATGEQTDSKSRPEPPSSTNAPILPAVTVTAITTRPWSGGIEIPSPSVWWIRFTGVSLFFMDANGFHDLIFGRQCCYGELPKNILMNEDVSPVPNATPGRETKGRTKQWDAPGGINEAEKDFSDKNPSDVREIPGGGKVGTLPDGRTIIVRPTSTDGRPTLEIQDGKNRVKVRYGP